MEIKHDASELRFRHVLFWDAQMEMLAIRDTPLNWRSLTWKLKAECVYTNGPTKPLLEIEFRVSLDDHRFFSVGKFGDFLPNSN